MSLLARILKQGEWWQLVFAPLINRADRPVVQPVLDDVELDRAKFTEAEMDWMIERAGGRCECVAQDCHKPSAHRIHSDIDGRCLGDFSQPSVQAQGEHLIARSNKGATDPVLNGAVMCGPCNQFKLAKEWDRALFEWVAENRLLPTWPDR